MTERLYWHEICAKRSETGDQPWMYYHNLTSILVTALTLNNFRYFILSSVAKLHAHLLHNVLVNEWWVCYMVWGCNAKVLPLYKCKPCISSLWSTYNGTNCLVKTTMGFFCIYEFNLCYHCNNALYVQFYTGLLFAFVIIFDKQTMCELKVCYRLVSMHGAPLHTVKQVLTAHACLVAIVTRVTDV